MSLKRVPSAKQISQDGRTAAEMLYGTAYHAYWQRDYDEALDQLTEALQYCDDDARVWYYKGLAEVHLGDDTAATESFAQAVVLHRAAKSSTRISVALERVQGNWRLRLETARQMAYAVPEKPTLPHQNDPRIADHRLTP
ncbi:MAG: hypothetical protein HYV60_11885 [Planctomycetia bacterium]|nr:hypothetical protein [Planctomycetia bacterium]